MSTIGCHGHVTIHGPYGLDACPVCNPCAPPFSVDHARVRSEALTEAADVFDQTGEHATASELRRMADLVAGGGFCAE